VTTDLVLGSISYRTLAIGPGRLTSQRTDGGLDVTLHPTGLAGGRVEATARLDQLRTIKWSGSGEGVDMAAVFSSFTPGELPFLTGTGSFSTSGTGLLMEGPVRRQLTGTAQFTMTDGQFLRSPALRFLAKYTKVDELETLRFDRFETKLSLEEGTIHVDQMSVTGQAASLDGTGRVTPENALDGRLFVKIGSSLRTKVNIPCMSALLATPDGFTTLPFALKVKGTVAQPEYAVDTAAWQYAKGSFGSLAGTMKTLLRGCRQGIQDSGSP
jgi:hypothetical protein